METIKGKGYTLKWRGDEVVDDVLNAMAGALGEIGLRVEGAAKQELRPGHGVLTGTLRRSIHTARPDYVWFHDDMEPSKGSPELGGRKVEAAMRSGKLTVAVGSGLHYAIFVHQGHDSFSGYHYLTSAVDKVRAKVPGIVERYALK